MRGDPLPVTDAVTQYDMIGDALARPLALAVVLGDCAAEGVAHSDTLPESDVGAVTVPADERDADRLPLADTTPEDEPATVAVIEPDTDASALAVGATPVGVAVAPLGVVVAAPDSVGFAADADPAPDGLGEPLAESAREALGPHEPDSDGERLADALIELDALADVCSERDAPSVGELRDDGDGLEEAVEEREGSDERDALVEDDKDARRLDRPVTLAVTHAVASIDSDASVDAVAVAIGDREATKGVALELDDASAGVCE
jgi:hypothetical protein